MRHLKIGWKLKRTYSHRKALLRNLAMDLIEHKKIETTLAKAKALRPFVEKLITKAKKAYYWEKYQNETNPRYDKNGNKIPQYHVFYRRFVGRFITKKPVLQELFETIAPIVVDRPGGYTRIMKTGFRRGDAAEMAIIELVDWGAPQDGAISLKSKTKAKKAGKAKTVKSSKPSKVKTDIQQVAQEQVVEPTQKTSADLTNTVQLTEETPVAPATTSEIVEANQPVSEFSVEETTHSSLDDPEPKIEEQNEQDSVNSKEEKG